jgi:hypothetical protein
VRDLPQMLLAAVAAGDDARAERVALALGRLGDAALPFLRDLLADVNADCRSWPGRRRYLRRA